MSELQGKIKAAIRGAVNGNVEIEETPVGNVHVFAWSETFIGLSESARDRLVWPALERSLSEDELIRISVCVLSTPEEHETLTGT
jgi:acid stress-induced BolA-like protein IbaG/YrbA